MSRQPVSAVVIQQGRNEMHLDVGPVIRRVTADDKTASLGDVRGARSFAAEQISQPDGNIAELIVGNGRMRIDQRADVEVILQVLAHPGQIETDFDVQRKQMIGWPDT